jgi:hypothetical protein
MVHKGIQHLQSPDVFLNPKRRGTDAGDGKYDDAEGREWVDRVASHYRHKGVSLPDGLACVVRLLNCGPGQRRLSHEGVHDDSSSVWVEVERASASSRRSPGAGVS